MKKLRWISLLLATLTISASALAAGPDFTKAVRVARGPFASSKGEVAALFPNPDGRTARLEIWSVKGGSYEKIATAPLAGCKGCAGAGRQDEWMPLSLRFHQGELWADYAGGFGSESWAWRSQWVWDFILKTPRARAAQRIGSSAQGGRLVVADYVSGEQTQRSNAPVAELRCRLPSFSAPEFEELTLKALFEGRFEPGCLSGTERGSPLAATPRIPASFAEDMLGVKRAELK